MSVGAKVPFGDYRQTEGRLRGRVDRICAKDSEALGELYDETSSRLYGLAIRILNDPADAEEVVLDVYQQVWASANTFDENRGSVWTWLTILTRNRALDRLRGAGSRRKLQLPAEYGLDIESGSPGPEIQIMHGQTRDIINRALLGLSVGERLAIELAYFGGLTHIEIAAELSEPLGTIKTRIRSGIRKLRDAIEPIIGH